MSLTLVSVPIGNKQDITLRALNTLKAAEVVVGEERKPLFRLLKSLDLPKPEHFELLNEHSRKEEIIALAKLCRDKDVALITDCGTPGFCDPGAELVHECRKLKVPVTANPGAASISTFISLTGKRLDQFLFRGFLPRESSERIRQLKKIKDSKIPVIIMDTPYRLTKTLDECSMTISNKKGILGLNLTQEDEQVLEGSFDFLKKKVEGTKKEFLLLIF